MPNESACTPSLSDRISKMINLSEISGHGTYALILTLVKAQKASIGRLGRFKLKPGSYVYVGSAFGPGGLAARIAHHCRTAANPRWHIDYLRTVAALRRAWCTRDPLRREHQWADIFAGMKSVETPVPGFGASDCRCRSHLFHFSRRPTAMSFARLARVCYPGSGRICRFPVKTHQ